VLEEALKYISKLKAQVEEMLFKDAPENLGKFIVSYSLFPCARDRFWHVYRPVENQYYFQGAYGMQGCHILEKSWIFFAIPKSPWILFISSGKSVKLSGRFHVLHQDRIVRLLSFIMKHKK